MRRPLVYLLSFLTAATLAAGPIFTLPAAAATRGNGPCDGVRPVPALITCVADRFPPPGGAARARAVAWCESRYRVRAVNGRFAGLYQVGGDEWETWDRPQLYRRWFPGDPGRFHARAMVITSVFHASRVGWGAWSC